jgi:hypothetical protein
MLSFYETAKDLSSAEVRSHSAFLHVRWEGVKKIEKIQKKHVFKPDGPSHLLTASYAFETNYQRIQVLPQQQEIEDSQSVVSSLSQVS